MCLPLLREPLMEAGEGLELELPPHPPPLHSSWV